MGNHNLKDSPLRALSGTSFPSFSSMGAPFKESCYVFNLNIVRLQGFNVTVLFRKAAAVRIARLAAFRAAELVHSQDAHNTTLVSG